ncbi:MAG: response regulator transcription factor [Actinobacteria bacterium]|nr:response regulator transcription factor [Actinomycetota bacterium]
MIRVMVADDQELVRAGIARLVTEEDIAMVAEAVDGEDALAQARAHRPDVILMDVRMPGTDGVTATRAIIDEGLTAQNGQPIGIIMLTTFGNNDAVDAALRAGATGFLLKSAGSTQIVAAIRAVVAGKAWLDPGVIPPIIKKIIEGTPPFARPLPAEVNKLTNREREIVTLLAQGLSDADIAAKLVISVATVKTHVVHAMPKVGTRNRTLLAIWAYQTGLVHPSTSAVGVQRAD